MSTLVTCPTCGASVSNAAPACIKCGEPLAVAQAAAATYNQYVMQAAPAVSVSSKSRTVYVLLALFLGLLGIHDFYAGHTWSGVAFLLCTIFLGWLVVPLFIGVILIFIEMFTVTADGAKLPMKW